MTLSVALITLNEERNISECLESVKWADEIVIIDSGSTDRTREVSEHYSARFLTRPFKDFADQKNFALAQAKGDWIFLIDADERVTPELAAELRAISAGPTDAVYEVRRRTYFFLKPLRFSGTQNDAPIRLFPRGKARYEQPVHEYISTALPVKRMRRPLLHFTTRDLNQYKEKLRQYLAFEIDLMRQKKRRVFIWEPWVRPLAKFFYIYIIRFGILDGLTGLKLAILSAYYDHLRFRRYIESTHAK